MARPDRRAPAAVCAAAMLVLGLSGCESLRASAMPEAPLWLHHPGGALSVSFRRALTVEGHPPGHPHQPGAKTVAVAQLAEAPVRLRERFLRDVLGVLAVAKHAVGNAHCQGGRLDQAGFELVRQRLIHGQAAVPGVKLRSHLGAIMHVASPG